LENAATFAALKAEDTQIALTVDCPKNIGAANIDERRIKQVLFNLLSNAFAYTGAAGGVTLGASRNDGVVKLWVEDTGRGISPEDGAKVFDAFVSRGPSGALCQPPWRLDPNGLRRGRRRQGHLLSAGNGLDSDRQHAANRGDKKAGAPDKAGDKKDHQSQNPQKTARQGRSAAGGGIV